METIVEIIAGIVIGILATLGVIKVIKTGKKGFISDKDYEKIRKEKEDELENKSASDIVNGLESSDDISRIKRESDDRFDEEYGKRKDRKRRTYLDRFGSSGTGRGDEKDKE
ncbi:MAG: hypothetical protein JXB88_25535 [Spirochaetales bacterium]|nr:hypothetical protein [Spirochaetales bacterium]